MSSASGKATIINLEEFCRWKIFNENRGGFQPSPLSPKKILEIWDSEQCQDDQNRPIREADIDLVLQNLMTRAQRFMRKLADGSYLVQLNDPKAPPDQKKVEIFLKAWFRDLIVNFQNFVIHAEQTSELLYTNLLTWLNSNSYSAKDLIGFFPDAISVDDFRRILYQLRNLEFIYAVPSNLVDGELYYPRPNYLQNAFITEAEIQRVISLLNSYLPSGNVLDFNFHDIILMTESSGKDFLLPTEWESITSTNGWQLSADLKHKKIRFTTTYGDWELICYSNKYNQSFHKFRLQYLASRKFKNKTIDKLSIPASHFVDCCNGIRDLFENFNNLGILGFGRDGFSRFRLTQIGLNVDQQKPLIIGLGSAKSIAIGDFTDAIMYRKYEYLHRLTGKPVQREDFHSKNAQNMARMISGMAGLTEINTTNFQADQDKRFLPAIIEKIEEMLAFQHDVRDVIRKYGNATKKYFDAIIEAQIRHTGTIEDLRKELDFVGKIIQNAISELNQNYTINEALQTQNLKEINEKVEGIENKLDSQAEVLDDHTEKLDHHHDLLVDTGFLMSNVSKDVDKLHSEVDSIKRQTTTLDGISRGVNYLGDLSLSHDNRLDKIEKNVVKTDQKIDSMRNSVDGILTLVDGQTLEMGQRFEELRENVRTEAETIDLLKQTNVAIIDTQVQTTKILELVSSNQKTDKEKADEKFALLMENNNLLTSIIIEEKQAKRKLEIDLEAQKEKRLWNRIKAKFTS